MTHLICKKLIELARNKTTWSYSTLNQQLELGLDFDNRPSDRLLVSEWSGDISEHEFHRGCPLLSALSIHKNDKEQGTGFYNYANVFMVPLGRI